MEIHPDFRGRVSRAARSVLGLLPLVRESLLRCLVDGSQALEGELSQVAQDGPALGCVALPGLSSCGAVLLAQTVSSALFKAVLDHWRKRYAVRSSSSANR
jgi:hypothetical protein